MLRLLRSPLKLRRLPGCWGDDEDMAADILEVIDGALADYATSNDAMRWAPPGSVPEPDACDPEAVRFYLGADLELFVAGLREIGEVMIAAMQFWGDAVGKLFRELAPTVQVINDAHRARMSEIHREYSRRCRARRRRR